VSLALRSPLKMDVIRDRGSLAREVEGGRIENVYRLQVMNTREQPQRVTITVAGDAALGPLELRAGTQPIEIPALTTRAIVVQVRSEPGSVRGPRPIAFKLTALSDGEAEIRPVVEKSRFVVP